MIEPDPGLVADASPIASASPDAEQSYTLPGYNWARSRDVIVTLIGSAVILYVVGLVLERFTKVILIFVMSAIIAFVLEPVVGRLDRRGIGRGWATAVVYLAFVVALGAVAFWTSGGLATEFTQLNLIVPTYGQVLQQQGYPLVQNWLASHGVTSDLSQLEGTAGGALQTVGTEVAKNGLGVVAGLTNAVVDFVLTLVVSLYLVLDGSRIKDNLVALVPTRQQRLFLFLELSLVRVLGGYIRGQLVMAAIIGVSSGLGCWILGVQFPLVIGVLAFFFELIPMIGPVLAAIPAIVISLFQPFPLVLYVVGFFVVMQLIESNVLGPRITGHAVGLHPIASILALVAGAEVAGLWGALFAVPVVGLAVVLGSAALNDLRGRPADEVIRARKPWRLNRTVRR